MLFSESGMCWKISEPTPKIDLKFCINLLYLYKGTNTKVIMEKLKNLRKQRGYTQEYMMMNGKTC